MKIFDVRDRLSLLVKQTTQVGIGFLVMLLLTGGRLPAFVVNSTACLSIVFVTYSEVRRLAKGKVNLQNISVLALSAMLDK